MNDLDREMISSLSRYIQIDTSNPPGDCSRAVKFLKELFEVHGGVPVAAGLSGEKESIYCNMGGEGMPGLVLLHHMDVVPAKENEWSFPPFSGEEKDGYVLGRGTLDTKGLGIAQIFGFLKAKKEAGKLRKKIFLLANPDEEVGGGEGAGFFIKDHGEIFRGCYGLNEGGVGVKDLFGKGDFFLLNMWEKGPLWLKLIARGKAGHGSRPHPRDATTRLVTGLHRITTHEEELVVTEPVKAMFEELVNSGHMKLEEMEGGPVPHQSTLKQLAAAVPEMEAILKNTIAITMLEGGFKPNVIPAVAEASIDIRILPGEDPARVIEQVKTILEGLEIDVEVIFSENPSGSDRSVFFDVIRDALEAVYPGATTLPYLSTGFTDSRYYRGSGVVTYGLLPCVIPKDELGRIHGVDERISVEGMIKASEVIKAIILRMENL